MSMPSHSSTPHNDHDAVPGAGGDHADTHILQANDHADGHGHAHPHEEHGHSHERGQSHGPGGHSHATGVRGFFYGLFVPHTHDAADSIDDALEASTQGVRALKISLFLLLGTTVLQLLIFLISGSVALLADTIHNFSDALTALPLWIAFILGRRVASRRYTYGFGRAEDLAGLFIVAVVALSAIVAAVESITRFFHPETLHNLWWVVAAGFIGFAGNELVAIYRIRVGQRIGSAALVADGVHARLDGFTSLAVVLGALGVMAGIPLADPIIGVIISAAIMVLLWGTIRSIGRRLMDGIEPDLVDKARQVLEDTHGVVSVPKIQLRWVGHRLQGAATLLLDDTTLSTAEAIAHDAEHNLGHAMPNIDDMILRTVTANASAAAHREHAPHHDHHS
jgi:cation diffusion facilitator family transporter